MTEEGGFKRVGVVMPGVVWAVVLAQLRLALRHPSNVEGDAAGIGREFTVYLEAILVEEGVYSREEIEELHALEKGRMQ
jgi:hypothetical protein